MVEPPDNSIEKLSRNLSNPTGEGILIDIGTGDGAFVYQCARQNPKLFVIGIDANPRPLEKISEKIYRKQAKGGLPNALFLQAAVENLPSELDGVADEIHVHFPWASLLRALIVADLGVLKGLRRICAPEALLEIVISLDEERDQTGLLRFGIPKIDSSYIREVLTLRYREAGFGVIESGNLPPAHWAKLHTSWAKRLKNNPQRSLTYIVAQAI